MVSVGRIGPAGIVPAGARRAAASGFAVTPAASGAVGGPAAAGAPVALDGLLALQQSDQGETVQDRHARRHGQALLEALARLQRGLLGLDDAGPALADVAALVEAMPPAATPALATLLAGVALRARVELARRGL